MVGKKTMEQMIFDYHDPGIKAMWEASGDQRWSGAYYYDEEIIKYFIPTVKTDRHWILYNNPGCGWPHSIVFIHNNLYVWAYQWLKDLPDILLICGVPATLEWASEIADCAYLPISVDTQYVEQFKVDKKTKDTCYFGRKSKLEALGIDVGDVDFICGIPREEALPLLAQYENCYCVGRSAIEAKILGVNVLPYDPRYPDVDLWQIYDSRDAAKELQDILDEFEGR